MSRTTRWGAQVAAVGLAVAGAALVSAPTPAVSVAVKPANNTAADVLVVNANLAEVLKKRDVREPRELATFVTKVLAQTRTAPDVVTLQETNPYAAQNVADRLTQRTQGSYIVAYGAGYAEKNLTAAAVAQRPKNGAGLIGVAGDGYWANAVLINVKTVSKVAGTERRITFRLTSAYRSPDKARSGTDFANQSAGVMVKKKVSGTKYYVHSVHFPPATELKEREGGNGTKFQGKLTTWTNKLVESATKQGAVPVLAGDFNWGLQKTVGSGATSRKVDSNMWAILKAKGYRAAFPTGWSIDHIFTTGALSGAAKDPNYGKSPLTGTAFTLCRARHEGGTVNGTKYLAGGGAQGSTACKANYYADHAFTIARVS